MAILGMSLHIINVILLIILLYMYVQNYRHLKTKLTAGLILFAFLFLVQSLMNIYYDVSMVMYSSLHAEIAATVLEGVKAIAFGVLVWISWE